MFLSTLKRGSAIAVSTVLLVGVAANATTRAVSRPAPQAVRTDASTPDTEQVLIEGGTLAANYDGNLADILGGPIASPGFPGRDGASESSLPAKAKTNPQYVYAAIGTGGSQLDFVSQQSGKAAKSASTYPVPADNDVAYEGVSPATAGTGFNTGWAGTAASTTAEDTIHAAAGDAPIPLGPSEGAGFVSGSFTVYSDSLAAFDQNGDTTGGGFNLNRGPAKVVPVIGTGVRIIFNTSGLSYTAPLQLTQDDLCGIMTGKYTNFSQTSALAGQNQPITIVHRSDGSGTSFLTSYDLSQMCSFSNPFTGAGAPASTEYWNQGGLSQGVGTDSKVLTAAGGVPTDNSAPEVVWPNSSVGASKSSGVVSAVAYGLEVNSSGAIVTGVSCTASGAPTAGDTCTNPAGYVGYVTPSDTLSGPEDEAAIENYKGNYEVANATTVSAALDSSTTSDQNPPAYPVDNKTTVLYFPFPTAPQGAALVGFSYAYFYTCYPNREKDQAAALKTLFDYGVSSSTSATQATVAAFWNMSPLNAAEKKNLSAALSFKTAPVTKPTSYISPVDGSKKDYTCTDN
jgi:ABC-type phosphate transport system substrate-binding protein